MTSKVHEFESLSGGRVDYWAGVEMAVREESTAGGPSFDDPTVPCPQLLVLQASIDETGADFDTYQDGDV